MIHDATRRYGPAEDKAPRRVRRRRRVGPRRGTLLLATAVHADVSQKGNVLISFDGRLAPTKLPRVGLLTNTTSAVALKRCRGALIGSGHFRAKIIFPEAAPFPAIGRILSFNAITPNGTHVILAHIFGRVPLATTYILPFEIHRLSGGGTYGTTLTGTFPEVADNWGYVTHFDLNLKRKFLYKGRTHGFLNAGCPAPPGFPSATFNLARATYDFRGGLQLSSTLTRVCRARG